MLKEGDAPLFVGGWTEGATWANEQNAQEIAELVEALQLVTDQFSKLEKIYSRDRKIIGKCRELLSKYEK